MRFALATVLILAPLGACAPEAEEASNSPAENGPTAENTATHNALSAEEVAAGWELLFNGTSTEGWRGYGRDDFPTGGWTVEGGELVGLSTTGDMDGGDIVTVGQYSDFELIFDFKLGPATNSGVFYRVQEREGATLWEVAPEYQVLDDTAYFAPDAEEGRTHRTGDNYDLHEASTRPTRGLGEWNTGRIVVDGARVEHWLNGELTVSYEYDTDEWDSLVANSKFDPEVYAQAPRGSIGLQDHGTPVSYRNIKIRPIR